MTDRQDKDNTEKQDNTMKDYEFDGQTYIYTDKATNITYKFDQENNKWIEKENSDMKKSSDKDSSDDDDDEESSDKTEKKEISCSKVSTSGIFGFENDTHTYTDTNDGSAYFWDKEKNAWFPKVICNRIII